MTKRLRGLVFLFCCLVANISLVGQNVAEHIQPNFWWVGMKNPSLQILIHKKNVAHSKLSLQGNQLKIDSVVRLENPNYLLLYLDTSEASVGNFDILLDGKQAFRYELKARSQYKPQPFNAQDVIYLLMPDRFINGDKTNDVVARLKERSYAPNQPNARHGGDIKGMSQALDYFSELGVTAIWPTPLLINDMPSLSYHGYAITDYYLIDPRYGSNQDYKDFVVKAHHKGLKVIQDMVFNHCGLENFLYRDLPDSSWFNHHSEYVQTNYKQSAINDPYSVSAERLSATDGWFVAEMPDFNQRNPHVIKYLIQNSIYWIEYAGIDGIRQDTYGYADREAMAQWCRAIEKEYPHFNIVGETWFGSNVAVASWQKDNKLIQPMNTELRTVMDFPLREILLQLDTEETNDWDKGLARVYDYISQDIVYADPMNLLTFFENHDTERLNTTEAKARNPQHYKNALALLLTLRGIPQLYVGSELGMWGNKEFGDGGLRQDFPYKALKSQNRTVLQKEYFDYTKRLLQFRKNSKALGKGELIQYSVRNKVYVYARSYQDEVVTVVANGNNKDVVLDLETYREVFPTEKVYDVINDRELNLKTPFHLKANTIYIFESR